MNKIKFKLLGLLFICMFPFSMFFISLFDRGLELPPLFSLRRFEIMTRTIIFGLIVSFLVLVVSWLIGLLLMMTFQNSQKVLLILLALIMIPPFIHAYLWINTMYRIFNVSVLSGMFISVIVQSVYYIPLGILLWYFYFRQIGGEYFDEVRLATKSTKVLYRTIYTMSKAVVGLIFALVFILSITDFTIPSIFAFNTFPIEIMAIFSSQSYLAVPLIVSIPMVVLTFSVFTLIALKYKFHLYGDDLVKSTYNSYSKNPVFKYILYFLIVTYLIPYLFMIVDVWKSEDVFGVLSQYIHEYSFSLSTATIASIIVIILSYLICYYLVLKSEYTKGVAITMLIVFSIPNTILGLLVNGTYINLIELIPSLEWIYYSYIPIIHLYIIKFLPLGFTIMYLGFMSISKEKILQARLNTSNTYKLLKASTLYSLRNFVIISFFINLILAVGELGASIMVVPPGDSTITITIYNYLHYGSTDIVAILCLAVTLIIMLLIITMSQFIRTKEEV